MFSQETAFTINADDIAQYAAHLQEQERAKNTVKKLALFLQTICAAGIRVSELRFIPVEAVALGRTVVSNKGKRRTVFLPGKLRVLLKKYLKKQKITDGSVFVTRTGRPLDRSNIWRDMKALCESAGVEPNKVFPHNLRHLFARTYYSLEKDLSRLADILAIPISVPPVFIPQRAVLSTRGKWSG